MSLFFKRKCTLHFIWSWHWTLKEGEIFKTSALGDIQKALEDLNKPKLTNHRQEDFVEDFFNFFIYFDLILILINLGERYRFCWSSGAVNPPSENGLFCWHHTPLRKDWKGENVCGHLLGYSVFKFTYHDLVTNLNSYLSNKPELHENFYCMSFFWF